MPFEEKDEIQGFADRHGVYSISLVAPTSHDRIAMIAKESQGFLYCVSSTGVTGMRNQYTTDFQEFFETINKYAKVPCAVGFGISGPKQAAQMKDYCDGVIVGSAIVNLVGKYGKESPKPVEEFVSSLRNALDEGNA